MRIELETALSPEECAKRLRAHFSRPLSERRMLAVDGVVKRDAAILRSRAAGFNTLRRRMCVSWRPAAHGGSTLTFESRRSLAAPLLLVSWCSLVGAIAGAASWLLLSEGGGDHWLPAGVGAAMILASTAVYLVGHALNKDDEATVIGFLREQLEAGSVPPAVAAPAEPPPLAKTA